MYHTRDYIPYPLVTPSTYDLSNPLVTYIELPMIIYIYFSYQLLVTLL